MELASPVNTRNNLDSNKESFVSRLPSMSRIPQHILPPPQQVSYSPRIDVRRLLGLRLARRSCYIQYPTSKPGDGYGKTGISMAPTTATVMVSFGNCHLQSSAICKPPTPVFCSHRLALCSQSTYANLPLLGLGLVASYVRYASWYESGRDNRLDAVLQKDRPDC